MEKFEDNYYLNDSRKSKASGLRSLHWVIIVFSLAVTFATWYITNRQIQDKIDSSFERESEQVVELIKERMQKYEDALWSGVSAIHANGDNISYKKWKVFSESLKIDLKYPGINGIGVIYQVNENNFEKYLKNQQKVRPNFNVHPKIKVSNHWPITYIEPYDNNAKALGLDMAHEKNRLEALKLAIKSGKAQITAPIILVQDQEKSPGFLFFVPFYKESPSGNQIRESAGLVYAPFVARKLMKGVLEKSKRHVGVQIIDSGQSLYNEHNFDEEDYDPDPLYKKIFKLPLYGRSWEFHIWSTKSFREAATFNQPLLILIAGMIIDGLLIFVFVYLDRVSKKAIRHARKMDIGYKQRAKDLFSLSKRLQYEIVERTIAENEASAASEAKSRFLAMMSHEIRTPLNGILGFTKILNDCSLNHEEKQYVGYIQNSSKNLLTIVNDILDYSKIEAGKLTIEKLPVNVEKIVESSLLVFGEQAATKGLELRVKMDKDIPQFILTDPIRLRQILLNLISNAVKFTSYGHIEVSVKVFKKEDNYSSIEFRVKDTGIGIDKGSFSNMFNAFEQADKTTTRKYGGTGLGLNISSHLANLLGGELVLESTSKNGSTFFFDIKADIVDEKEIEKSKGAKSLDANFAEENWNILIVEDNVINQVLVKKFLEKIGCLDFRVANNGEEALIQALNTKFDIIFMDIQMPVMDGLDCTKRIRELAGPSQSSHIIGLSANAYEDDRRKAINVGMDDYLEKPLDIEKLIEVLNQKKRTYRNAS